MSFALRAALFGLSALLAAAEPLNNLEARATTTSFAPVNGCQPDCEAYVSDRHWAWFPVSVTATVTHATIIYIIKPDGTTSTSTKFNELPDGVTPPPTNDAGTQTALIPVETEVGKSTTINLAYPTEMRAGAPSYQWQGTLPTVNAMNSSICSTNTLANQTGIPLEGFTVPITKSVPDDFSTKTNDTGGMFYTLFPYACRVGTYLSSVPPGNQDDGAIKYCATNQGVCGVSVVNTVQFLTETSTSTEKSASKPPSTTPKPPPTTSKPTTSAEAQEQSTPPGQNTPPTTSRGATTAQTAHIETPSGGELNTPTPNPPTQTSTRTTRIVSTSNGEVVTRISSDVIIVAPLPSGSDEAPQSQPLTSTRRTTIVSTSNGEVVTQTSAQIIVFTPPPAANSPSTANVGDEIAGGLGLSSTTPRGPAPASSTSSTGAAFTGGASRMSSPLAGISLDGVLCLILRLFG